jgi:ADP-heptose:LPS heptosyltransferase
LLITGASFERELCERITEGIGAGAFCLGLSIEELTALIHEAPLVISVNTGTAHIAAATQTPVIVLYALTNPQHTPWNVASEILYFSVKEQLKSKNEIVNYVNEYIMDKGVEMPSPLRILEAAQSLLKKVKAEISYK